MKELNIKNLENKDNRIKTMNEILEGIKVIKLYAWERGFQSKVKHLRESEIKTMKTISWLNAGVLIVTSIDRYG